jgi:hypothetical protein
MVRAKYRPPRWVLSLRWIARIWSLGSLVLLLGFVVGEGLHPSGYEWLGLLFFPFAISLGMVLAWWKEGVGGSVTVGSLAAFYLLHFATAGTFPKGWAWLAFAAPGFLFLLVSLVSRRPRV